LNATALIRRNVEGEVFDYQVLLDALAGYRKPRDKITRLLASGAIVRVKKGLYCFGEAFRKEPLSREYLANLIYGPSYVSLEYALNHHGLIPERVETVTSVTTRRSRDFDTPFGTFSYRMLNGPRYAVGAILETAGKTPFLIASPEKALADKVWTDKRLSGVRVSDYDEYLSDDLRIDREAIGSFDYSRLHLIATAYDSGKVNNLVCYLKRLKEASHA
jgi:hypothetical protein